MEQFAEGESTREEIKNKLRQNFDGKKGRMSQCMFLSSCWDSIAVQMMRRL